MKALWIAAVLAGWSLVCSTAAAEFRVGAAAVDVTPTRFPVLINGGMLSRMADQVTTKLFARAIVMDDGRERLAIVVVDSCMMPRPLLDEAKQLASKRTKIRPDRMLISATHTHSAPASMGCLGTDADEHYVPYLREKLAEAIAAAEQHLQPARIGWAVRQAAQYTALRRWIRRSDRIALDPFGNPTVRANMHAARNLDDVTGESGPEDPDLTLISFQSRTGRPIAVLANFSMHYFSGQRPVGADYFGLFCEGMEKQLGSPGGGVSPSFVAVMSHGCSGDIWRRDYAKPWPPRNQLTIDTYAHGLVKIALDAYKSIEYEDSPDIAMVQRRMTLKYRVPDQQRLEWARRVVAEMGDRQPKNQREVYAREQIILHERQSTEIVVQAIRIGDIAIATTPTETYALTGLKLKLQSPLPKTMVIELANGGDGYIPPPEQHLLGGYNTWPARSAGLEVHAEPKIVEALLEMLEQLAGRPRRHWRQTRGPACETILNAGPVAYWRLDEFSGPRADDCSPHTIYAFYEPYVAFFLEGPDSRHFCLSGERNRSAHFAGGRLRTSIKNLGDRYSVSLWFYNGMPNDARQVAGWLFSRERDHGLSPFGDHLGIGGSATKPGRVLLQHGNGQPPAQFAVGQTEIGRWTWNHAVFVRDGKSARVYLNGNLEIDTTMPAGFPAHFDQLFFGGRSDNQANWEGRLDEIAVFDRALSADEVKKLAPQ